MRIVKYDTRLDKDKLPMLIKEATINYSVNNLLTTPYDIVRYLNDVEDFENLTNEKVIMICLDTKLKVIGTFEISTGSVNTSIVSTRDVFMRALAVGAVNIIIAHNHPSGNPGFSTQDKEVAVNIKNAGDILEIKLLDFIATGTNEAYASMHESGIV